MPYFRMNERRSAKSCVVRPASRLSGISDMPVERIEPYLRDIDLALCMTVFPGFGGQAFIPSALEKVSRARALAGARPIDIEIDGGVTPDNAEAVARAGANVLVAGSAAFKGGPSAYAKNIAAIRNAAAMARGEAA